MEQHYNVAEAIAAQKAYWERTGAPHFAPSDGYCWSCGRKIYDGVWVETAHSRYHSGISVEEAANRLITGCPHCMRSYCD